jgi:hypothetical protein
VRLKHDKLYVDSSGATAPSNTTIRTKLGKNNKHSKSADDLVEKSELIWSGIEQNVGSKYA